MAQGAVTIRLDNNLKSEFDKLYAKFGMSSNAAVNIFISAVVQTHSIPFSISSPADIDTSREKALQMINEIRKETYLREELSLDEINAEIRSIKIFIYPPLR